MSQNPQINAPEVASHGLFSVDPARDWPWGTGDNDNYQNECCSCKKPYRGHKRSIVCCKCQRESDERWAAMNTESRREFEEWANPKGYYLRKNSYIDITAYYESTDTEQAWEAWQAARERQWRPIEELGTIDGDSWTLKSGYEKYRLFMILMADDDHQTYWATITEDGTLHDANGDDTGWRWCDASYYMDVTLPNPPTSEKI